MPGREAGGVGEKLGWDNSDDIDRGNLALAIGLVWKHCVHEIKLRTRL